MLVGPFTRFRAPTATSAYPSPSTSPPANTPYANCDDTCGSVNVVVATADSPPADPRKRNARAPPLAPGAPTTTSAKPSRFTSPTPATVSPKPSYATSLSIVDDGVDGSPDGEP